MPHPSIAPPRSILTKCKHFDHYGKVITPCKADDRCAFIHPADPDWATAREPAPFLRDQVFEHRKRAELGRDNGWAGARAGWDRAGDREDTRAPARASSPPRGRRSLSPPRPRRSPSPSRRGAYRAPRSRSRSRSSSPSRLPQRGRRRSESRSRAGSRRSLSPRSTPSHPSERRSSPARRSSQNASSESNDAVQPGQKRLRVESDSSDALEKLIKRPKLDDTTPASAPTGPKAWSGLSVPSHVPSGPAALRSVPTPPQRPPPPLPDGAAPAPDTYSPTNPRLPIPVPHMDPIKMPPQVPNSVPLDVIQALSRVQPSVLQARDPRRRDISASHLNTTPPTPSSATPTTDVAQPTPMKPSARWKGYGDPPSVGGTPVPTPLLPSQSRFTSTPTGTVPVSGHQGDKPKPTTGQGTLPPLSHPAVAALQRASNITTLASPQSPSVPPMTSSQALPESSAFPFPPSTGALAVPTGEAMNVDTPPRSAPAQTNTSVIRPRPFPPAVVGSIIPEFRRTWKEIEDTHVPPPPTSAEIAALSLPRKRSLLSRELVLSTESRRLTAEAQKQVSRLKGMLKIYEEAVSDPLTSKRASQIETELTAAKQRAVDTQRLSDEHVRAVQDLMDSIFRGLADEVEISKPIRELRQDSRKGLDSLETRLERQERAMKDLIDDLAAVKKESSGLREVVKAQDEELKEAKGSLKGQTADNKRLTDEVAVLTRRLAEQEKKLANSENENTAMNLKIATFQDRMESLEKLVSDKQSEWDDGAERAQQLSDEVTELTTRLAQVESALQANTEAASVMKATADETKDRMSLMEMQHEELRTYTHNLPRPPTIDAFLHPLQDRLIPAFERSVHAKLNDTLKKANEFTSEKITALFQNIQPSIQLLDRGTKFMQPYLTGTGRGAG